MREGTPAELKADLRERRAGDTEPTLDDVFLDAYGRSRDRAAGSPLLFLTPNLVPRERLTEPMEVAVSYD